MSDGTEEKTLDLNELFGQGRPIKVLWSTKEYSLLRPEAFGAAETLHLARLQVQVGKLQSEDSPTTAAELEKALDDILRMLCPEFPVNDIPFQAKLCTFNFYTAEIRKNVLKAALKQIGVLPSAG